MFVFYRSKIALILSFVMIFSSLTTFASAATGKLSDEQLSYLLQHRQKEIATQRAYMQELKEQLAERKSSTHYLGATISLIITGFGIGNIIAPQRFGTAGEPELSIARFIGKILAVGGTIGMIGESLVIVSKAQDIEKLENIIDKTDKELEAMQIELNLISTQRLH